MEGKRRGRAGAGGVLADMALVVLATAVALEMLGVSVLGLWNTAVEAFETVL